MTERQPQPVTPEQEPKPKVLVTFEGINHSPLNLQGISRIIENLKSHLVVAPGTTTILLEAATTDKLSSDSFKRAVRLHGGLVNANFATLVEQVLGETPKPDQISRLREMADSKTPEESLDQAAVQLDLTRSYFLNRELDQLTQRVNLQFDVEKQTHGTVRVIEKWLKWSLQFRELARNAWSQGDFHSCLKLHREETRLLSLITETRDTNLIMELTRKIRKLLKTRRGGSIFIIFGVGHSPIIPELQSRLGPNPEVKFVINDRNGASTSDRKLLDSLRKNDAVTDELYAQHFFGWETVVAIIRANQNPENRAKLAQSFESIESELDSIAQGLTLDQIRTLCEQKVDLLEFLRVQPSLSPLIRELLDSPDVTSGPLEE